MTEEWQPIETAPKNGKTILAVVTPNPRKWCLSIIHWESGQWYKEFMPLVGKPTHWMPLPKPPEENK